MALFDLGFDQPDFYDSLWGPSSAADPGPATPGFTSRQPPPKRLTQDELVALFQQPVAPEAPTPYGSFRDLPADQQKEGKLNALWAGLAALSSGIGTGRWGQAAAGAGEQIQGIQDASIKRANAAQQADYEQRAAAAAEQAQQQKVRQQAGAIYGMYNRAVAGETPDGPFAQQAEAAARRGDMSTLEKMASPDTKSERASARARGLDPDAWDTIEQLKGNLKAQIEAANIAATSGPKAAAAAAEAKAVQDARLPGEQALKMSPSWQAPPQYEPLSRIAARTELVQSIEDKHAALREAAKQGTSIPGRLGQAPDGTWGWLTPPTKDNPAPTFTPIDGQPRKSGGLQHFQKDGQPYVWNPAKPELGAIAVQTHDAGEKGAPSFQDLTAPPPRPAPNLGMGGQGPSRRPIPGVNPAPQAPTPAPGSSKRQPGFKVGAHNTLDASGQWWHE